MLISVILVLRHVISLVTLLHLHLGAHALVVAHHPAHKLGRGVRMLVVLTVALVE